MSNGRIRGVGLRGIIGYIRNQEGAAFADSLIAKIPAPLRPGPSGFLAASSYDLSICDVFLRGYVEQLQRTGRGESVDALVRQVGVHVAEDNLNSVFKMVLALVKPTTYIEKLPTLWSLYLPDVDARATLTGPNDAICSVSGLEAGYLPLAAAGWLEFGLVKVGARQPLWCKEDGWEQGREYSPNAMYRLHWS
jgi:hypothetical protein